MPLSKKHEVMIDSLLDIGKNMDKVTCNEKIFYEDQNGLRKCRISEEIDLEYAEAKELEETEPKEMLGRQAKEEQFILGDTEETLLQNNSFDKTNQLDVSLIAVDVFAILLLQLMLVYNLTQQQLFVQGYVKFATVPIK